MKKEAVTVRQQRGPSKRLLKWYPEMFRDPSTLSWSVYHWGKFKHMASTQELAEEWAKDFRRKLELARWDREEKKRENDRRWAVHMRNCENGVYKSQWSNYSQTPMPAPTPALQTGINALNLQPFLESASNAANKGQAQYFTPEECASALAEALPRYRPVIVDLTCGDGHLLRGASRPSTTHLLGCDINHRIMGTKSFCSDDSVARSVSVCADLTKLYALMLQASFEADLFLLNPPWDLHWHRSRLALLAKSPLATVRDAFSRHDGRLSRTEIDSTVATLAIALDRCTEYGEGFLIGNESTLQRLILGDSAPHKALAQHIWAHLVLEAGTMFPGETGVIYFARSHEVGLSGPPLPPLAGGRPQGLESCQATCKDLWRRRLDLRDGPDIKPYLRRENVADVWEGLRDECDRLFAATPPPQWNLSLRQPGGTIVANLTLFDTHSGRIDKELANSLFLLDGKLPLQLVMLKQQRRALERAVNGDGRAQGGRAQAPYRVDPALQEAVKQAVREYESIRAPLYPLPPIQRLGYLDEQDEILCKKSLSLSATSVTSCSSSTSPVFSADHSYKLSSTTVAVKRTGTKVNLRGELDEVEWDGQELAFWITDNTGMQRLFMEARLRAKNVEVSILSPGERPGRGRGPAPKPCSIDFTLHQLIDHFEIPDVPDVARINPKGYEHNLQLLNQIEALCSSSSC